MKTVSTIEVTSTYLEMRDPAELQAARSDDPLIRVEQMQNCPASFFRYLYVEVGRSYRWIDRLPWTDEQIRAHLKQTEITMWLMTYEGAPAGYFGLRQCDDGSIEVAYFGLFPEVLRLGFGQHLLTCAVHHTSTAGPSPLWLP